MRRIYKYQTPVVDVWQLELPRGAEILSAGTQGQLITIWAVVDPDAPLHSRPIHIYGTGELIKERETLRYINSVFMGQFVWHLFEPERV